MFYGVEVGILRVENLFERLGRYHDQTAKNPTLSGNWNAMKHFGDSTTNDKKIAALKNDHKWAVINREAGPDESTDPAAKYLKELQDKADKTISDTNAGITGGGVRNLTINIAKQGVDNIVIHAATLKEGIDDVRNMFIEMFNQVVNSGNAAVQDH